MIISSIILVIAFLSLLQSRKRKVPALIVSSLLLTHDVFLSELAGEYYYISDAVFCLVGIILTANLKTNTRLIIDLQRILLACIIVNFYGWLIWMLYFSPFTYNMAFIMLYCGIIIALLSREGVRYGNYKMDKWATVFQLDFHKCFHSISKQQKKDRA